MSKRRRPSAFSGGRKSPWFESIVVTVAELNSSAVAMANALDCATQGLNIKISACTDSDTSKIKALLGLLLRLLRSSLGEPYFLRRPR